VTPLSRLLLNKLTLVVLLVVTAAAGDRPEFYGVYAEQAGEWVELTEDSRALEHIPTSFLLFSKRVALGQVELDLRSQRQAGAAPVLCRARPVKGQPEMIEWVPRAPLIPGRYAIGGLRFLVQSDQYRKRLVAAVERGDSDSLAALSELTHSFPSEDSRTMQKSLRDIMERELQGQLAARSWEEAEETGKLIAALTGDRRVMHLVPLTIAKEEAANQNWKEAHRYASAALALSPLSHPARELCNEALFTIHAQSAYRSAMKEDWETARMAADQALQLAPADAVLLELRDRAAYWEALLQAQAAIDAKDWDAAGTVLIEAAKEPPEGDDEAEVRLARMLARLCGVRSYYGAWFKPVGHYRSAPNKATLSFEESLLVASTEQARWVYASDEEEPTEKRCAPEPAPVPPGSLQHVDFRFLEMSADSKIAAVIADRTLQTYDAESGDELARVPLNGLVRRMWFAGNTAVAVEAVEHTDVLRIYSAQDGELIKELRGPWSMVRTSQDGRQIVVYHRGELVIHAVEGDVLGKVASGEIEDVAFHPDGGIATLANREITLWSVPGRLRTPQTQAPSPVADGPVHEQKN